MRIDDELQLDVVRGQEPDARDGERLGEASSIRAALEQWHELRCVGDAIELTMATDDLANEIGDVLIAAPVLAPPEGWEDGYPNTPFLVPVNGDDWLEFDIGDGFGGQELASISGTIGCISIEFIDGWLRRCSTDVDDAFDWIGTDADDAELEHYGVDLVLSPPMWPSGSHLEVNLLATTSRPTGEIVDKLTDGRLGGYFDSLVFNGRYIELTHGRQTPN
ncbi:MAG: hypothetical protein ACOYOQ_08975 [Microthrixaceae bacterium]